MLPTFETKRVLLREVELADGPELQEYENTPEHTRLQATEPAEYADGTLRIKRYIQHRGTNPERRLFVYVARCRDTGVLIGQFGLSRFQPQLASLGFGIAAKFWGLGYATEIAAQAIRYGFSDLGLHRISADVAVENHPSKRVLEKIGMTPEGTARDCIWAQNRWWSEARYAILSTDPANRLREVLGDCG